MAKFQVQRGGGRYEFPTLGIIANDGDVLDLPDDTDVVGIIPVADAPKKSAKAVSDTTPDTTKSSSDSPSDTNEPSNPNEGVN